MQETRKVEIYKQGAWIEISFTDLKVGDKFRMFEPTGERVLGSYDLEGINEWIVIKGPYRRSEDEVWTVEAAGEEYYNNEGISG